MNADEEGEGEALMKRMTGVSLRRGVLWSSIAAATIAAVTVSIVFTIPRAPSGDATAVGDDVEAVGGWWPPPLEEPIVWREGEYWPLFRTDPEVLEYARSVARNHDWDVYPMFEGEVNGILVDPTGELEEMCDPEDARRLSEAEVEEHSVPTPSYLPPGTVEWAPAFGSACGDELDEFVVNRQFEVRPWNLGFNIWKRVGEPYLRAAAPTSRVSAGEINGMPAVFIEPWVPEGWGNSWIAWRDGPITYVILAADLPWDEVLAIALSMEV